jgi:hypothetical protein
MTFGGGVNESVLGQLMLGLSTNAYIMNLSRRNVSQEKRKKKKKKEEEE